ncbi:Cytochrome c oxidase subunit 6A, mitochondrial [Xylographa opegraphella]|nr:Cytochrome c oxidase subunit 6A, mitochondrial [Xylographa opegraphella]
MLSQRSLVRVPHRIGLRGRAPTLRLNFQRRLAHSDVVRTDVPPLTGAADNAFNRERQAVKAHAAATSGNMPARFLSGTPELIDDRSLAQIVDLVPDFHSFVPRRTAYVIASVNAYNLWTEHWDHWNHLPPLEERVEYPYQNIRTKNFPWGDGDKVSVSD